MSYVGFTVTFQSTVDQIGVPILAFTFGTGYLHENKHLNRSKEHFRGPSGYQSEPGLRIDITYVSHTGHHAHAICKPKQSNRDGIYNVLLKIDLVISCIPLTKVFITPLTTPC